MSKIILMIDDEPDFLNLTSTLLISKGYKVLTAQDGQEGLQKSRTAKTGSHPSRSSHAKKWMALNSAA